MTSAWHDQLLDALTIHCGAPDTFTRRDDTIEVGYPGVMLYVPVDADIAEAVAKVLMVKEEGGETVH